MLRRLTATTRTWFPLPLRLSMGLLFALHGAEKVFGIHGGPGLSAWVADEKSASGLRPAWFWLGAAALCELIGGLLILTGFLTRLGALLILPVMLIAIYGGLSAAGISVSLVRVGYPLMMLAAAIALLISGGGRGSVDEGMMKGRRW